MRVSVAALAFLMGLGGCELLQPKVSQSEMEDALSKWLASNGLVATDIHCPDNQILEKGNVFECTCKVHEIEVPVRVKVTDASTGAVEWEPKYLTIKSDVFADEVKAKPEYKDKNLQFVCADPVLVSIPDSEWNCDVVDGSDGGKRYLASVKFSDGKGSYTIDFAAK